ncbi:S41 family peptidase [Kitasatospora albolonga]|uniref:S41 family peptidase n=1 Tax=Kitasatospora albolonga TaxID=68173 RepID=UPI003CD053BD
MSAGRNCSPGATRDRSRAVLVGSRTFGKGTVQQPSRLRRRRRPGTHRRPLRHPGRPLAGRHRPHPGRPPAAGRRPGGGDPARRHRALRLGRAKWADHRAGEVRECPGAMAKDNGKRS